MYQHQLHEAKCRAPFTGMARWSDCPSRNTDPERLGDLRMILVEVEDTEWKCRLVKMISLLSTDFFIGAGTHLFFHVKLQESIFVGSDLPLSLILNVVCQIAG